VRTVTKVTANHAGHLEFRLCPLESKKDLETEECFAKYPLRLKDGSTVYNLPSKETGDFEVDVILPNIKCEQCVLQWTYVTGVYGGETRICSYGALYLSRDYYHVIVNIHLASFLRLCQFCRSNNLMFSQSVPKHFVYKVSFLPVTVRKY
jgi:hypothetical protein